MKTFKTILMGATALSFFAGMAYAQSNDFRIEQNGSENTASANQSGAGSNTAGTSADPVKQDGSGNEIDITQTSIGSANKIGVQAQSEAGVDQMQNGNVLEIVQEGKGHKVIEVQQTGGTQASGTSNTATIEQTEKQGTVDRVGQTYTGNGQEAANSIDISQSAQFAIIGANANGNGDGGIFQNGFGNQATTIQTGYYDVITRVEQENANSLGGANNAILNQAGSHNRISGIYQTNTGIDDNTVDTMQTGTENRIVNIDQIGGGNSADVGQADSYNTLDLLKQDGTGNMAMVSQSGMENNASVDVLGDYNTTDVTQDGVDGQATINVSGSNENDVAVNQHGGSSGASNVGTVMITGASDGNRVDLTQTGDNVGTVDLAGGADGNDIDITQGGTNLAMVDIDYGDDNLVTIDQDGTNEANITIDRGGSTGFDRGDNNRLNVMQDGGSANPNIMTVNIDGGSGNNNPASAPIFGGDAGWARDMGVSIAGLDHLYKGDLYQSGDGNETTLTVSSDDNAFAMVQDGSNNTINGTISGGAGSNQAVVVQTSSDNSATFTQSGFGNNLGIVQGGVAAN